MSAEDQESQFKKEWESMNFECQDCGNIFKPDLLKDEPGRRVRVTVERFYPPRNTGGDWSPVEMSLQAFAECPDCGRITNSLTDKPVSRIKLD